MDSVNPGASERPIHPGGDAYGSHRVLDPKGALVQPAWRVDNDFSRLFEGEALLAVETLNIDAASFAQMEEVARAKLGSRGDGERLAQEVAQLVMRTVGDRGKQHNPVTGSGGMLLGRVLQLAPGRTDEGPGQLVVGDRVATLVSLSLTPLRLDEVRDVREASAQMDVRGEAVLFASSPYAKLPSDIPERVAVAAFDVAGAASQVARRVETGDVVLVLGAGGKSGVLCAAEARRRGGPSACVVGVEANRQAADDLRALGLCDAVICADARAPLATRSAVLRATGGREADVAFSCVNVADAEMSAILSTRDRGVVCFFAMSTSFTKAALGAEGVGKDVDLVIGNGYAAGHAEHTLGILRSSPALLALFVRRYG